MVFQCICYMKSSCLFPVCLKTSAFSQWCALMSLGVPAASSIEVKTVRLYIPGKAKIKNMY